MSDEANSLTDDGDIPMKLPDELDGLARQVGSFALRPAKLNRDAVMFAAGAARGATTESPARQRVAAQLRRWRVAAVAMASTSISLGGAMLLRPEPTPRMVVVERIVSPSSAAPVEPVLEMPVAPRDERVSRPNAATVSAATSHNPASSEFVRWRQQLRERGVEAAFDELARLSDSREGRDPATAIRSDEPAHDETRSPSQRSRRLMQQLLEESRL